MEKGSPMAEHLSILLALGNGVQAAELAAAFGRLGWRAEVADNVTQALLAARKSPPDAVVLDVGLAASGCLITLKRLRASVDTAATPVILIGECPAPQREALMAAGAQMHAGDGSDTTAVCAGVQRHLGQMPAVHEAPAEVLQSPLRMAALRASGLLDTPPDVAFDRVTGLAARLLGVPTALLSLVDKDRQFFKSQVGVADPWASARQTPLTHSFCQWVVCGREPVKVNDARQHPVLRNNAAIRDMSVIAYLGVPVHSAQGEALGSLCALEAQPRAWNEHDQAVMVDLSRLVESCVAHAQLIKQPPKGAADFDPYVEAAHGAIAGALGILRRDGAILDKADRHLLYDLIEEYGSQLVQLNRLIQVNQVLG